MPRISIGSYLILLVCAIVLPVLLLAGLVFAQLQSNENESLERRTVREAQSIATSINPILFEMATTLRILASAPELENGNLSAFHARTKLALRNSEHFAILVDESNQQLLNTRVAFGTPLGPTADPASLRAAFESDLLEISGVFMGRVSGEWVFNLILPIGGSNTPNERALIVTKNAEELDKAISSSGLPEEWHALVLDQAGNVVAASDPKLQPRGERLAVIDTDRLDGIRGSAYGEFEGRRIIVGYSRMSAWGWTAIVWGPVATAQTSILDSLATLIFGGIILLALAIGSAIFVADRLGVSIRGIAQMAEGVGRGEVVSPIDSGIREVDMIARTLSTASFDRSQAEEQIRLVLRELAHRSKNLLTVVLAIIRQIARRSETIEEFRSQIEKRVAGLARSIELLTAQDWEGVEFRDLIDTHMATFVDSRHRYHMSGPSLPLKPEAVQSLGLVLHELATNASKYGALSVPGGSIRIEWIIDDADAEQAMLTIKWTETGGPPVSEPESKGFGTEIIERHAAAAFSGDIAVTYEPSGYRWTASGPLSNFVTRRRPPI